MKKNMTPTEFIEFLNKKRKEINKLTKMVNNELDIRYTKDLNKIIKRAISDFYSSYKPRYYKRKYSLKYMYKVTSENGVIDMDFDGEHSFAYHRLDNDKLFNLVFIEGWHGGAKYIKDSKVEEWGMHPDPGTPYWRTPHPDYTEWGYRAENSESPMERIDKALMSYETKIESIQDKILDKKIDEWFFS